jgi:hypothetical protein
MAALATRKAQESVAVLIWLKTRARIFWTGGGSFPPLADPLPFGIFRQCLRDFIRDFSHSRGGPAARGREPVDSCSIIRRRLNLDIHSRKVSVADPVHGSNPDRDQVHHQEISIVLREDRWIGPRQETSIVLRQSPSTSHHQATLIDRRPAQSTDSRPARSSFGCSCATLEHLRSIRSS